MYTVHLCQLFLASKFFFIFAIVMLPIICNSLQVFSTSKINFVLCNWEGFSSPTWPSQSPRSFLLLFPGTGDWTQSHTTIKPQAQSFIFWDKESLSHPGWSQTCDVSASASYITRITGIHLRPWNLRALKVQVSKILPTPKWVWAGWDLDICIFNSPHFHSLHYTLAHPLPWLPSCLELLS